MIKNNINPSCLIIIPTHNEFQNLEPLLIQIFEYLPEADILIIDDNSSDGTHEVATYWATIEPRVRLISRPEKLGLGSAYCHGFAIALNDAYEYVIQMDADFSHPPAALPKLFEHAKNNFDIIVGSRYVNGGNTSNWSLWRRQLSILANRFIKIVFNIPISDLSSGFRCLKRDALSKLARLSYSPGYAFQVEMIYHAHQIGLKMEEIPINFTSRATGKSKLSIQESLLWIWSLLKLRCKL